MKKYIFPLICLISILITGSARASGYYFGLGLANGDLVSCDTGACSGYSVNAQEAVNIRLVGGYEFNPRFGVEVGWSKLGTFKISESRNGTAFETIHASTITMAAKRSYRFNQEWAIFGKLGLAKTISTHQFSPGWNSPGTYRQSDLGPMLGYGLEYRFNEKVTFRFEEEIVIYYNESNNSGISSGLGLMASYDF